MKKEQFFRENKVIKLCKNSVMMKGPMGIFFVHRNVYNSLLNPDVKVMDFKIKLIEPKLPMLEILIWKSI